MVAEILAHSTEFMHHRHANRAKQRCRPNPRDLQQLRGIGGATAQDDLAPRMHRVPDPVAIMHTTHPDGALALEQHRCGPRVGAYIQTSCGFRRMQEHTRCRMAPATMDRALEVANAGLVVAAVVVGATRDPHTDRAGHECLADRMEPIHGGNWQVAVATMDPIIPNPNPAFGALVVGQHIDIAPAAIAALRPAIQIGPLAAVVDHAVDRTGPTQRATLGRRDRTTAAALGWLCLELPSVVRVEQDLDEAG